MKEEKREEVPDELIFGNIIRLYDRAAGRKSLTQLDALYEWFPELIVVEDRDPNGVLKAPASYEEKTFTIHAVRYNGRLHGAGSKDAVTNIINRLYGTARSSLEKGRKDAELIQRHAGSRIMKEKPLVRRLQENVRDHLSSFDEEQIQSFGQSLMDTVLACAERRASLSTYEKEHELFAMDDSVFDTVLTNAMYELVYDGMDGLIDAWLWLSCGSLLRNECWRLVHTFNERFMAVWYAPSEDGSLMDSLHYILCPEDYGSTFEGNEEDLQNRFPDIHWICDACGSSLNDQKGFDDHLPYWKCTQCGHMNRLSWEDVYETESDAENDIHRADKADALRAITRRKRQLKKR